MGNRPCAKHEHFVLLPPWAAIVGGAVGTEDLDHIVQDLIPSAGEKPLATPGNFMDLLEKMDENLIT